MSQIIGSDIIATPSHSSGTIVLPPSLLTLGGRQYRTSTLSRLISADVTLVNATLYFVYVQLVSGVPALRISANPPSVYTISNPTAKLVRGLYANGVLAGVGFGSFVNPEGIPRTDNPVQFTSVFRGAASDPSKSGSILRDSFWFERDGKVMIVNGDYVHTVASAAGSGDYGLEIPGTYTFSSTHHLLDNSAPRGSIGNFGVRQDGSIFDGKCHTGFNNRRIWGTIYSGVAVFSWSSGAVTFNTTQYELSFDDVRFKVTQFSETPLKDL